jgi:hypothetical protein
VFGLDVFLPLLGAFVMLLRGGSPAAGVAPAPAPAPAWDRTQTYEYEPSRDTMVSQARTLYQYLMTHSGAARDRQYVAALQTRLGLVGDGLVGRQTATRIRELTGLTLPGF